MVFSNCQFQLSPSQILRWILQPVSFTVTAYLQYFLIDKNVARINFFTVLHFYHVSSILYSLLSYPIHVNFHNSSTVDIYMYIGRYWEKYLNKSLIFWQSIQ